MKAVQPKVKRTPRKAAPMLSDASAKSLKRILLLSMFQNGDRFKDPAAAEAVLADRFQPEGA